MSNILEYMQQLIDNWQYEALSISIRDSLYANGQDFFWTPGTILVGKSRTAGVRKPSESTSDLTNPSPDQIEVR